MLSPLLANLRMAHFSAFLGQSNFGLTHQCTLFVQLIQNQHEHLHIATNFVTDTIILAFEVYFLKNRENYSLLIEYGGVPSLPAQLQSSTSHCHSLSKIYAVEHKSILRFRASFSHSETYNQLALENQNTLFNFLLFCFFSVLLSVLRLFLYLHYI